MLAARGELVFVCVFVWCSLAMRLPCVCHAVMPQAPAAKWHGHCVNTAWQRHGNTMATAWQQHGTCGATAWQLRGNCVATARRQHGNCMATTWQQHGNCAGRRGNNNRSDCHKIIRREAPSFSRAIPAAASHIPGTGIFAEPTFACGLGTRPPSIGGDTSSHSRIRRSCSL